MKFEDLKKKLLENPKFRKEYERHKLAREIAEMIAEARTLKGISQKKLAEMVGTRQPSIARLENASSLPSLNFLKRICDALGVCLIVQFDSSNLRVDHDFAFRSGEITDEIPVFEGYFGSYDSKSSDQVESSQSSEYLSI